MLLLESVICSHLELEERVLCAPLLCQCVYLRMSLNRRRVTLTLPPELHDRAKAVLDKLPGANFSGLIEDALLGYLPALEAITDAYLAGGEDSARRALAYTLGEELIGLREGVHTPLPKGGEMKKGK